MNKADLFNLVMRSAGNDRIAEIFPELVNEVEARLNERLRLRELMQTATLDASTGSAALPSDFARMRFVTQAGNPSAVLRERSMQDVLARKEGYAIGNGEIRVYPGQRVDVHYWVKLPSLNDNNTNALLERGLGVYHAGIMAAYEALNGDIQKAAALWVAFDQLVTSINASEDWTLQGYASIV